MKTAMTDILVPILILTILTFLLISHLKSLKGYKEVERMNREASEKYQQDLKAWYERHAGEDDPDICDEEDPMPIPPLEIVYDG